MRPDRATARELLDKATEDQAVVILGQSEPRVADSIVGFHAQQAAEKCLKAVLAASGVEYPFTHDLLRLVDLIDANGIDIPASVREARRLTPFAVEFRYGALDDVEVDRDGTAVLVADVIGWARNQTH